MSQCSFREHKELLLVMKSILFLLLVSSCVALAATEEQIQKTFSLDPGGTLVVDVDFGSIEVTTNSTSEVAVNVWRKITRKKRQMRRHSCGITPSSSLRKALP